MVREDLLFGNLFDLCPESWDVVPFEEAIDFQEGPGIMAVDFHDTGVPLIRLSGVQRSTASLDGCNFLDPEKVTKKWNHFRLKRGDLLISTSATIGMVSEIGPDTQGAVAYTGLIRLRPRTEKVCPGFIKHFASSSYFVQQAEGMAAGSVLRHFGPSHLRQMAFPIPPLAEQKAIAGVLGALDDKIELNRRMNATLEAMARALFQSWFVDFDPVRAKLDGRQPVGLDHASAALFPDHLEDSALGLVPRGWKVCPLAELIEVVKGRSYRSEELAESNTALVTLKSFLRGGGYRTDGLKPFTGEYKPNQRVRTGDLVVAFTDVTQAADVIGKPALVRSDDRFETLVASLDVGVVRPKSNRVSIPFLYCLFLTSEFQAHTYSHATGTTVLHLGSTAIPSFITVLPPAEIAVKFAERASPIFHLIDVNSKQSRTLASLRDTLLPKLLSGELRVREAEAIAGQAA
jgi:type I restriction enzyme S subunit